MLKKNVIIKNDLLPLLKLAMPLILTGLIQSSIGFFVTLFLARLGQDTLAAGALVSWLYGTFIVILFGTFSAVNILVAHNHGANDHNAIAYVMRDGFILALLFLIPAFLLFWNISFIFHLVNQKPPLIMLATGYLHALAWGLLPKFILILLFELVLGLGHSRTIMVANLLMTPIYIFLSFALIFGKLGFPTLGISGAGWGMTIADWLIAGGLFIWLFFSNHHKSYLRSMFSLQKPSYLGEIIQIGAPMGAMYCLEIGFFLIIALLMGTFSMHALAANQIVMQYSAVFMSVVFSIAQAITIRMGHQIGAKQTHLAKRTAYTGIFLAVSFTGVVAILYWIFPDKLIAVDFDLHNIHYKQTIQLTVQFLFIAAFFQLFEAARIALFGALRALKDTRFTLFASTIGFWLIPFPVGYGLAVYFDLEGAGLWWGMVIGAGVSTALLSCRLKQKTLGD